MLPVFLYYITYITKAAVVNDGCLCSFGNLCLGGSAYRAGISAGAAFNAGFGIDFILAIAFADRGNGAFRSTGAAADAFIGNLVSHGINLLISVHADPRGM